METNPGELLRTETKRGIESFIANLVETSRLNSLGFENDEKAWSKPLVGFSRGDDAYYHFFKQDIGEFYWLPQEVYARVFDGEAIAPDSLSVISWVLPQTRQTKSDQRRQTDIPSERWCRSRLSGEAFNNFIRQSLVDFLCHAGFPAFAPMLVPSFRRENSRKYGFASSWSERHAAFVAGLGTFGLSDGLITPVGKAIRCGSVIAKISLEPTARPYTDHRAYCLFFVDGSCSKCADRCPAGAIEEGRHDKVKCSAYIRQTALPIVKRDFNLDVNACGLCQVKVPCESGIPLQIRKGQSRGVKKVN